MKTMQKIVLAASLLTMLLAIPMVSQAAPIAATVNYVMTIPKGTDTPVTYVSVTLVSDTTRSYTLIAPSGAGPMVAASAMTALSSGLKVQFEANNGTITSFYLMKS